MLTGQETKAQIEGGKPLPQIHTQVILSFLPPSTDVPLQRDMGLGWGWGRRSVKSPKVSQSPSSHQVKLDSFTAESQKAKR